MPSKWLVFNGLVLLCYYKCRVMSRYASLFLRINLLISGRGFEDVLHTQDSKPLTGLHSPSYCVLSDSRRVSYPVFVVSLPRTNNPLPYPTKTSTLPPWPSPSPQPASQDPNLDPAYSADAPSPPRIRKPALGPMQSSAPRPLWGASHLAASPFPSS